MGNLARPEVCGRQPQRTNRALILNATYEPIGIVSVRRALILSLAGKVDVLADVGRHIDSITFSFEAPSVVRLRYYVKVPFRRTAALNRKALFARDKGRCQYCGKAAESVDHIIPRSKGGTHTWENVVACCRRCNTAKGDLLLANSGMKLRSTPVTPSHLVWLTAATGEVPEAWTPFLTTEAA